MPKGYPKNQYPEQYAKESPVPETTLSIEQVLVELKQAEQAKDSAQALLHIADTLDKLTPEDREQLLATPSVAALVESARVKAARDGKPGSVVCDSRGRVLERVEWTYDALAEEFGQVMWTPMQTRWLTFNGVQVWVQAGVDITTPPQFRDLAQEGWRKEVNQLQEAKEIVYRNFGPNSLITTGDGTPL